MSTRFHIEMPTPVELKKLLALVMPYHHQSQQFYHNDPALYVIILPSCGWTVPRWRPYRFGQSPNWQASGLRRG